MKPRQETALEKRARALLETLNGEIGQMEELWQQGNLSVSTVLSLYQTEAKRLRKRLEGNPRTLRRRLTALNRDLTRRAKDEASIANDPYDPSWGVSRLAWERVQQGAALRGDALTKLATGLGKVIRPG